MKKKLAAIAMATAMAASLAACSSKPAETTAAAEENEETTAEAAEGSEAAEAGDSAFAGKTLVMSTNAEFAPYEYHDGNDIVGIDVDIANAICEDMGASLEITDVAFDSIIPEVQSGKADFAAAGMTVTEDRQTQVDFSDTYATGVQSVIVTEDSDIASLDDLKGKQIGVQEGTTSDFLISDLISKGTLANSALKSFLAPAIAAAQIGKIDAVIADKLTAGIIVANNSDKYKTFKLTDKNGGDVGETEQYGIAVAKGNTELLAVINEVIDELLKDGSIEKWVTEYSELAKKIELFAFRFGTQNYVGFNGNRVAHVSLLHFILNLC